MTEPMRRQRAWRVALVFWLALGLRAQLLVLLPERVTQWMVPMESNWDEPAPPARYAVLAGYFGIAMFATWLASRRILRWWRSPRALRRKSWAAAAFPTAYRALASVAETPCGHQLGIAVPVVVGWTAAVAIASWQSWLGPPAALDDAIAALLLGPGGAQAQAFDWKKHDGQTINLLLNNHPWSQAVRDMAGEFTAKTGIKLRVEMFNEEQFRELLDLKAPAGEQPRLL